MSNGAGSRSNRTVRCGSGHFIFVDSEENVNLSVSRHIGDEARSGSRLVSVSSNHRTISLNVIHMVTVVSGHHILKGRTASCDTFRHLTH